MQTDALPTVEHEVDFCVVGGGMAGLCAAVSAARHGATVALMQDRPVLGGNASGECRVHICGADRHNHLPNRRETGILEELRLKNLHVNPQRSFSVWDTLTYELARYQDGLTLLLNCSAVDATLRDGCIETVTGLSLTEQRTHRVRARIFADCSGDGILAPLTGHPFRMGTEARDEYDEPSAPEQANDLTMGMSLLFQTRPYASPQPFTPPEWAYTFNDCHELPYGPNAHGFWNMGYWWVELGGEQHAIHDTEAIRDELLKIAYGVWDHIKNHCPHHHQNAANWALEWMQFLPGKRESRRYIGAHVLTQNDVLAEGRFDDLVAYGGWTMDDHPPQGFWGAKRGSDLPSAVHHKTPSPYGIPYRSLYSETIPNLMFAGRCHSATHLAMSSTRVMGTGCSMGQAIGTAAAMAIDRDALPAGIGEHIDELQQGLLRDDCYLPWTPQQFGPMTMGATIETSNDRSGEVVRDGVNRPVGDDPHRWQCAPGEWISLTLAEPAKIDDVTLVLDSALHKDPQMSYHRPAEAHLTTLPAELPKAFQVHVRENGRWGLQWETRENHSRQIRFRVGRAVEAVRFTLESTWGAEVTGLHAFYVD